MTAEIALRLTVEEGEEVEHRENGNQSEVDFAQYALGLLGIECGLLLRELVAVCENAMVYNQLTSSLAL